MQILKLEIEDSNVDIILNIIKNLKDDIVYKYELISLNNEQNDFINVSQDSLEKIWDNEEDSVYDKYLKVWYCCYKVSIC